MSELFPSRGTSAWRWVKCHALEAKLLGLPDRIPWPGEIPDPSPSEALNAGALLKAIPRAKADPSAALEPLWERIEKILEVAMECLDAASTSDFERAERLSGDLARVHPCPLATFMRATTLRGQGRHEAALPLLEELAGTIGELEIIWLHLGVTYEAAGKPLEAVDAYQRGRKACPTSVELAEALRRHGKLHRFSPPGYHSGGREVGDYVDVEGYRTAVDRQLAMFRGSIEKLERLSLDVSRHAFDLQSLERVYAEILALDPGHIQLWPNSPAYASGRVILPKRS